MDSIILASPFALFLYGTALFFNLYDQYYKVTKGILTILSCIIVIGSTVYVVCIGASLWECATVLLGFLIINMGVKE